MCVINYTPKGAVKGVFMSRIAGLITEYNPFHNGHRYHAEMAKELTKADYTLSIMSGNFLQRGSIAVFPKI